jgi:protein arginine kinase activator
MKLCDECGINPANIHLTQIMLNETQVSHLCEDCARKKGISVSLNNEETTGTITSNAPPENEKKCKKCNYSYSTFRKKGWLGCSECYQSFEKEIDELLIQMHGSLIHKGKRYTGTTSTPQTLTGEMKRLRHELAIAIKNEEFEQAATIRDAIHTIKQMGVL